jgi:hypothetical protein
MKFQELRKAISDKLANCKSDDERHYYVESFGSLFNEIMSDGNKDNEMLNISDYLFELAQAVDILKKYHINRFTYSAMTTGAIEQIYNFNTFGYRIAGLTTVKRFGSENPAIVLECAS